MSDSVKKAFRIMRFLAGEPEPAGLALISRALKLNKTTAYRYLQTLGDLDLVEKSGGGYSLGLALFELGNRVPVKNLLVGLFDPTMRRLCLELNETVNMGQLHHDRIIYLHKIESRRSLQMREQIGSELPLHCTALGKAILSALDPARYAALTSGMAFSSHTGFTITSPKRLKAEIDAVRRRGFSIDQEEFEIGLTCVAVPVVMPQYDFIGALSVSGPSMRIKSGRVTAIVRELKRTRADILKNSPIGPSGQNKSNMKRGSHGL